MAPPFPLQRSPIRHVVIAIPLPTFTAALLLAFPGGPSLLEPRTYLLPTCPPLTELHRTWKLGGSRALPLSGSWGVSVITMAEWVLQRERGLSWQQSQACFPAACHHPNGRPSLGTPQGAPDPRDYRGTLQRKSQGNWVWEGRTHQLPPQPHSPHGGRGLRQWGQESGSGPTLAILLSPARPAALPEGCVGRAMQAPSAPEPPPGKRHLPRRVPALAEPVFPPLGGRVVFKVKVSARLHFELPPQLCL